MSGTNNYDKEAHKVGDGDVDVVGRNRLKQDETEVRCSVR